MDWGSYDDIKVLNAIHGGDRAAKWARRTFWLVLVGFVVVSFLIITR